MASRDDKSPDQYSTKKEGTKDSTRSPGYNDNLISASPPQFMSLQDMMDASHLVTNMRLAHEIALDENFKLESQEPPPGSLEQQVADTMKRAFWDALAEKLEQVPPDYSHALILIEEVKEKLVGCLLPQHQRLRDHIHEVLDMQLIQQKIENGAFDILYYADFVRTIMSRLCAPARDDEVAALKEIRDVIPLFKELFRLLDVMHLDMANYTIQQMRPHIQQQSVTYERAKFEEFLRKEESSGIDGLEYTREWLERSFDSLNSLSSTSCTTELFWTTLNTIPLTPANILHGAYMELLNWSDNIFPETCLFDAQRFLDLAFQLRRLVLVSATLLVTFNSVGASLSGCTDLRDKLKNDVLVLLADIPEALYKEKMVPISEHLAISVNIDIALRGYTSRSPEQLALLKEDILKVADNGNPVRQLLWKRMMTVIFNSIAQSPSQPIQLPSGLGAFGKEIPEICGKFLRLIAHNKAVFGQRYADMVAVLMEMNKDISPRSPSSINHGHTSASGGM